MHVLTVDELEAILELVSDVSDVSFVERAPNELGTTWQGSSNPTWLKSFQSDRLLSPSIRSFQLLLLGLSSLIRTGPAESI